MPLATSTPIFRGFPSHLININSIVVENSWPISPQHWDNHSWGFFSFFWGGGRFLNYRLFLSILVFYDSVVWYAFFGVWPFHSFYCIWDSPILCISAVCSFSLLSTISSYEYTILLLMDTYFLSLLAIINKDTMNITVELLMRVCFHFCRQLPMSRIAGNSVDVCLSLWKMSKNFSKGVLFYISSSSSIFYSVNV